MRMHPRRHGAYNFSARMASAIVNEHYKNKKKQQRYSSPKVNVPIKETQFTNEGGCLAVIIIICFISIIIIAAKISS